MSYSKLDVEGPAPFKESGVYEAQISILGERPSDEEIKNKSFFAVWSDNYHLLVKNDTFNVTLGFGDNPIPESVYTFEKVWIIVNDLLSTRYSIFELSIHPQSKQSTSPVESIPKTDVNTNVSPTPKTIVQDFAKSLSGLSTSGSSGPQGAKGPSGPSGDKGPTGYQGPTGDKGPTGEQGGKGSFGEKGWPRR